ncbi:hypothetical protein NXF25_017523 [Crotalus adamanteus]|uniref:Uncharacterized protein n=1 Tax=Crotalus adamanteus TaxID=8729 RepID=A0AAW1AQB6_CROAD
MEWKGWSAPPTEEMLYGELTDQLKEARFVAGVAEQFAITEATLSSWPPLNDEELSSRAGSQEVIQLQARSGRPLSAGRSTLLPNGSRRQPPDLRALQPSPPHPKQTPGSKGPEQGGLGRAEGELVGPPNSCRWQQRATLLYYADSSSPSEDQVFYD